MTSPSSSAFALVLSAIFVGALLVILFNVPYSGHEQLIESVVTASATLVVASSGAYAASKYFRSREDRTIRTGHSQSDLVRGRRVITVESVGELLKVAEVLGSPILRPKNHLSAEEYDVVLSGELVFLARKESDGIPSETKNTP